jgi:hypothetical protein
LSRATLSDVRPDLDSWLEQPVVRIHHRREADVEPEALWAAARSIRLADTRALGRLIRMRIPGVSSAAAFDDLFRAPPFTVLHTDDGALVSGLVGRIWTVRRDYPPLAEPDEFRRWTTPGTARVLFATWVEPVSSEVTALVSETRVATVDRRAWMGLAALRPLIATSQNLIGRDGIEIAIKRARHLPEAGPGAD